MRLDSCTRFPVGLLKCHKVLVLMTLGFPSVRVWLSNLTTEDVAGPYQSALTEGMTYFVQLKTVSRAEPG